MEVKLLVFLTFTLAAYHTLSVIYPCIWGWVGPRHGLATMVKRKVSVEEIDTGLCGQTSLMQESNLQPTREFKFGGGGGVPHQKPQGERKQALSERQKK